jgi:regulator of cell morphogenesis and NO signaling
MNHSPAVFRPAASSSAFAPTTRVGDIVAARPLAASIFQRLGIDYCCAGKKTLAEACALKKLDPTTVAVLLDVTLQSTNAPAFVDAAKMSLAALADHIEATHHAYLKEELPIIVEQAERVAIRHADHDPRLAAVAATVREFAGELLQHIQKEERVLFPLVRELETARAAGGHCGSISNPIRQMESEHESAGDALARLRELTADFTPPDDACNTHRALLAGLARLEADLHQHVHKENNVLFPRAIALEKTLSA